MELKTQTCSETLPAHLYLNLTWGGGWGLVGEAADPKSHQKFADPKSHQKFGLYSGLGLAESDLKGLAG